MAKSKFNVPTKDLDLEIYGKPLKIPSNKYYVLDSGKPVLSHATLKAIADKLKLEVCDVRIEYANFNSVESFNYVYRAFAKRFDGIMVSEVGEANPMNVTGISLQYPAIMANKRAVDRLIIRLLGLSGTVYSDSEF